MTMLEPCDVRVTPSDHAALLALTDAQVDEVIVGVRLGLDYGPYADLRDHARASVLSTDTRRHRSVMEDVWRLDNSLERRRAKDRTRDQAVEVVELARLVRKLPGFRNLSDGTQRHVAWVSRCDPEQVTTGHYILEEGVLDRLKVLKHRCEVVPEAAPRPRPKKPGSAARRRRGRTADQPDSKSEPASGRNRSNRK